VNASRLTPCSQTAGTRLTYRGGMEGRLDLGGCIGTETVYLSAESQVVTVSSVEKKKKKFYIA